MTTILLISWLILIVASLKGAEMVLVKAGKL
jgi:hypothetical protein